MVRNRIGLLIPGLAALRRGRPLLALIVALMFWTSGTALVKCAFLGGPLSKAVKQMADYWAVPDAWKLKEDRSSYGVDDLFVLNVQPAQQSLRRIQPIIAGHLPPYPEYPLVLAGFGLAFLASVAVTLGEFIRGGRR